jgi:hypothetical protein
LSSSQLSDANSFIINDIPCLQQLDDKVQANRHSGLRAAAHFTFSSYHDPSFNRFYPALYLDEHYS